MFYVRYASARNPSIHTRHSVSAALREAGPGEELVCRSFARSKTIRAGGTKRGQNVRHPNNIFWKSNGNSLIRQDLLQRVDNFFFTVARNMRQV